MPKPPDRVAFQNRAFSPHKRSNEILKIRLRKAEIVFRGGRRGNEREIIIINMNWLYFPAPSPNSTLTSLYAEFIEWIPLSKPRRKDSTPFNGNEKTSNHSFVDFPLQSENELMLFRSRIQGIPILHLQPQETSTIAILYFHANREDIFFSYPFLDNLRNNLQVDVYAVEYPGYSIYEGKVDMEKAKADSLHVFDYLSSNFSHVLAVGRSIGTVIASFLASKRPISILGLISPFYSLQSLIKQCVGLNLLPSTNVDLQAFLPSITSPVLIVHGKEDKMVEHQHSIRIFGSFLD